MEDMKNLAVMFSSIAQMLQEREDALLEKIAQLEARVVELEEKVKEAETGVVEQVMPEEEIEEPAEELAEEFAEEFDEEPAEEESCFEAVQQEEIGNTVGQQPEIEIEFEFEEEQQIQQEEALLQETVPAGEPGLIVDKARPDWYDWEVDIPGPYIEDIRDGIGLNDRILFLNELFYGDEEEFASVLSALNGMNRLVDAVEYIRERYPQWNEESDEVYRFYMTVRRRFNKQIQEG